MLLENNNAVAYGAGGAIGGAVARAFAHEGLLAGIPESWEGIPTEYWSEGCRLRSRRR